MEDLSIWTKILFVLIGILVIIWGISVNIDLFLFLKEIWKNED